jgi:D-arginine dehydrogenase
MESVDFLVIGAGLAGASTAYHLSRMGAGSVLIVEQEDTPGMHSSGRNAAMIRQVVGNPEIAKLAREGAAFLRQPPSGWDEGIVFEPNGSLLLSSGQGLESLKADLAEGQRNGVDLELWGREKCIEQVDALEGANFEAGVWCASDGVVDVAGALHGYLREAQKGGCARIETNCAVKRIVAQNGKIGRVETSKGVVRPGVVVNAAGPWVGLVGQMAGAAEIPFVPWRRHLFATGPMDNVDAAWPFVWDVVHDVYFRPESQGLLMSACDESADTPGFPETDPSVIELLAEKLERHIPRLADAPILNSWAGLRTMAPDRSFVIGQDSKTENFFWVGGLGGHGVTTGAAVGRLAAQLLAGELDAPPPAFDPRRFPPFRGQ